MKSGKTLPTSTMESLEYIDQQLFLWFNGKHHEYLDPVFLAISDLIWWTPLFLFLLFQLFRMYPGKAFGWIILGIVLSITLTDRLSVEGFKEVFLRYRPCYNTEIRELVHLVKSSCGGLYGFVSSHAANVAGVGTLVYFLLRRQVKGIFWILLIWVVLVGYSRIYIGVHYPADVLGGYLLGILCGWVVFYVLRIFLKRYCGFTFSG
jgi:undecaprenyl-diphosphatase